MNTDAYLLQIILYELRISSRSAFEIFTPLLFFIIVVCLFPLSIGSDLPTLEKIAPGIIWVAALLAILISLQQLFREEVEKGSIDLLILSPLPLSLIVMCKIFSHWLMTSLPLIVVSPLLGLMLNLNGDEMTRLIYTLLLGTPILVMLGTIGAALTIGMQGRGILLPILIMPFYIPVLIFGTGTINAIDISSAHAEFALLAALLFLTLTFAPYLTALALKNGVDQ